MSAATYMFRVFWRDENDEGRFDDVRAHNDCEAAWKTAQSLYSTAPKFLGVMLLEDEPIEGADDRR